MKEIKIYKKISMVLIFALIIACFKTTTATLAESLSLEENNLIVLGAEAYEGTVNTDMDLYIENTSMSTIEESTTSEYVDYENATETITELVAESGYTDYENTTEETTESTTSEYVDYENATETITELVAESGYTDYEIYELAKIVMCEAEGESQECKEYVTQTVINRVNDPAFPDTIHDVIFEDYQFTPTFDGRWEIVEPNTYCYDAVNTVLNADTPLTDALYFEACIGESWHSQNLELIIQFDNTRFYR